MKMDWDAESPAMKKSYDSFTIYFTRLGENQAFITVNISDSAADAQDVTCKIYEALFEHLKKQRLQIIYERIFCSLEYSDAVLKARRSVLEQVHPNEHFPFTLIQGHPVGRCGLAGIQLRAFDPSAPDDSIWTLFEHDKPVGKGWRRHGATFIMLQNIFGNTEIEDRYQQTSDMFDRANSILTEADFDFKYVLRTWIYISKILDWYGEFNRARNARFTEFGLLGRSEKVNTEAEKIYLPASTGILGENPQGAVVTMDVLAVHQDSPNISVYHTTGSRQKSPYRYGSAFSRAMTLKEKDITHILLSGTASIDEHGKTVFLNDPLNQIRHTLNVIKTLIAEEGASLADIIEATVFFKRPQDLILYEQAAAEFGISDLPAVYIMADVCREDLMFEIDAVIAF